MRSKLWTRIVSFAFLGLTGEAKVSCMSCSKRATYKKYKSKTNQSNDVYHMCTRGEYGHEWLESAELMVLTEAASLFIGVCICVG